MAHHPLTTPLEVPNFDGLSSSSVLSWMGYFLGWHIPALSDSSCRIITKTFNDYPRQVRKYLFRHDLLPHKVYGLDSFEPESDEVKNHYAFTWALRHSAIRDIHRIYRNPNRNRVNRYAKGHQLWVPESEIRWLKLFRGMRQTIEGHEINYPWGIRVITHLPPRIDQDKAKFTMGESIAVCFNGRRAIGHNGYWPLSFGSRLGPSQPRSIQFDRLQPRLGIKLPKVELGQIWVETGAFGPQNRVLFQKTASDESIGILIWPQLPGETSAETAQPTPRVPVYQGDVVELADNDRILVFVGLRRGINDVTIQINICFSWIRPSKGQQYADTKYCYPNPCERYPHCVRRPIYSPLQSEDPEILEDFCHPVTEAPSLAECYAEAREGASSQVFNNIYKNAKEALLKDLRKGILPEVVKEFVSSTPAIAAMAAELPSVIQSLIPDDLPSFTVEFPDEPSDPALLQPLEDEEYQIEITDVLVPEIAIKQDDDPDRNASASSQLRILGSSSKPGPSCLKQKEDKAEHRLKRWRSVTFATDDQEGKNQELASASLITSPSIESLSNRVMASSLKRSDTANLQSSVKRRRRSQLALSTPVAMDSSALSYQTEPASGSSLVTGTDEKQQACTSQSNIVGVDTSLESCVDSCITSSKRRSDTLTDELPGPVRRRRRSSQVTISELAELPAFSHAQGRTPTGSKSAPSGSRQEDSLNPTCSITAPTNEDFKLLGLKPKHLDDPQDGKPPTCRRRRSSGAMSETDRDTR